MAHFLEVSVECLYHLYNGQGGSASLVTLETGARPFRILLSAGAGELDLVSWQNGGEGTSASAQAIRDALGPVEDQIDLILLPHATLSHIGALPILMDSLKESCIILATGATKQLAMLTLYNCFESGSLERPFTFFSQDQLDSTIERITGLAYGEPFRLGPVSVTACRAGHTLGGAFFDIEVSGAHLFVSMDQSGAVEHVCEQSQLFNRKKPSMVVTSVPRTRAGTESTSRQHRDARVTDLLRHTVQQQGTCAVVTNDISRVAEVLSAIQGMLRQQDKRWPVYVISPLADVIRDHLLTFVGWNPTLAEKLGSSRDNPLHFGFCTFLSSYPQVWQSAVVDQRPKILVVIGESGWGRFLVSHVAENKENSIVFLDMFTSTSLQTQLEHGLRPVQFVTPLEEQELAELREVEKEDDMDVEGQKEAGDEGDDRTDGLEPLVARYVRNLPAGFDSVDCSSQRDAWISGRTAQPFFRDTRALPYHNDEYGSTAPLPINVHVKDSRQISDENISSVSEEVDQMPMRYQVFDFEGEIKAAVHTVPFSALASAPMLAKMLRSLLAPPVVAISSSDADNQLAGRNWLHLVDACTSEGVKEVFRLNPSSTEWRISVPVSIVPAQLDQELAASLLTRFQYAGGHGVSMCTVTAHTVEDEAKEDMDVESGVILSRGSNQDDINTQHLLLGTTDYGPVRENLGKEHSISSVAVGGKTVVAGGTILTSNLSGDKCSIEGPIGYNFYKAREEVLKGFVQV